MGKLLEQHLAHSTHCPGVSFVITGYTLCHAVSGWLDSLMTCVSLVHCCVSLHCHSGPIINICSMNEWRYGDRE